MECSKCEKILHLNTDCSGLTAKQQTALRASENLDWLCQECKVHLPRRRTILVPDDNDNTDSGPNCVERLEVDGDLFIKKIAKEVENAVKKEMREITKAVQHNSDDMDDMVKSMNGLQKTIQELKKINVEISNKNIHLETRVGALEQRIAELEQRQLSGLIEIANVPRSDDENVLKIVTEIGSKMQLPEDDITSAKRLPDRKKLTGTIQAQLKDEEAVSRWMVAAKKSKIYVSDIVDNETDTGESQRIFIRELLTPHNKKLLWNAKQLLKDQFKYIWCKHGVIRVRQDEDHNSLVLRTEEDIQKLQKKQGNLLP